MPQRALPHPCTVTIHIVTALIKQRTIESVMILRKHNAFVNKSTRRMISAVKFIYSFSIPSTNRTYLSVQYFSLNDRQLLVRKSKCIWICWRCDRGAQALGAAVVWLAKDSASTFCPMPHYFGHRGWAATDSRPVAMPLDALFRSDDCEVQNVVLLYAQIQMNFMKN